MAGFEFSPEAREKIVDLAWDFWVAGKAAVVKEAIQANTPVGVHTAHPGELRSSIHYRSLGRGSTRTVRFSADSDHAVVNHDGHGVLTPRQAVAMVFTARSGDKVFATRVRAVEGSKFFTKTLHELGFSRVTERSGRG